jgi:hypothetical protein
LCKLKMIKISQVKDQGTIWIMPVAAEPESESVAEDDDER